MNDQPIADALNQAANTGAAQTDFFVKTLTGHSLVMKHDPNLTIAQIKKNIADSEQISVEQQRLIFHGKNLEDANTISYYEVPPGATLHLVLRLRGGC
jgi:ubiquitin-large subunit ribosomal protein L40e